MSGNDSRQSNDAADSVAVAPRVRVLEDHERLPIMRLPVKEYAVVRLNRPRSHSAAAPRSSGAVEPVAEMPLAFFRKDAAEE